MLFTIICLYTTLFTLKSQSANVIRSTAPGGVCEPRGQAHPEYPKCPNKHCLQHIDCWVSFGPPQSCVCDPHLCGPVCLPENSKCPTPKPISNGKVIFNGTDVGESAKYSCKAGLVVRGPRNRHCLATLKWSGEDPLCSNQTNTCFSPPYVANTQVQSNRMVVQASGLPMISRDDYRSGEIVRITCLPGYRDLRRDYVEATCVGSEWKMGSIDCERISCDPLKDSPHGHVVYRSDKRFQAEAMSVCAEGFKADCGSISAISEDTSAGCLRVCQADGTWSGNDALCRPILCPRLEAPSNGGVSGYSTTVGSVVMAHCNLGFELIGSMKRQCSPNGQWDGERTVCKIRNCGQPPRVARGKVVVDGTTYGSKALIKCEPDTTFSIETNALYCGLNDNQTSWLPQPIPTCNRHCYLFTVQRGDVVLMHQPNTPTQRFIPITADAYGPGKSINSLGATNGLSAEDSQSRSEREGIILPNGRVRHGEQLNVTCHEGHELLKLHNASTKCTDGVWSIRIKCVPASCSTRPPSVHGARVRFYSRKHNAKARYECQPGFQLRSTPNSVSRRIARRRLPGETIDPLGTIRCLHGQWMVANVYCEPLICPQLIVENMIRVELKLPHLSDPDERYRLTSNAQHGTLAQFTCPKGFHIVGSTFTLCHNGTWMPDVQPQCERSTHEPLPNQWFFRIP